MIKDDYRKVLIEHYQARKQRNPAYSLRSFARDLNWSAARLCQVMNGKAGLSVAKAAIVAQKLSLPPIEQQLFEAMVARKHAKSKQVRKDAAKSIRNITTSMGLNSIHLDSFKIIRDWYHLAILELTKIQSFQSYAPWIAQKLGISVDLVDAAIARLKQLGMLKFSSGKLCSQEGRNAVISHAPSEAIREFHKQILNKAIDSLYGQPMSERQLSASIVAINKADLPKITSRMQEFKRELCAEFGASADEAKENLYCISMQCFSLERSDNV